jgi:hypothetical protein
VIGALRCEAVECRRLHPVVEQAENVIFDNGEIVAPRNFHNRVPALARHGNGRRILQGGNEIKYFCLARPGRALEIVQIKSLAIHGKGHRFEIETVDQ